MRYYTSGHDINTPGLVRTGEYETLEEALLGLCQTADKYEMAYLCHTQSQVTVAYLYHSQVRRKKEICTIKFHFDKLRKIIESNT